MGRLTRFALVFFVQALLAILSITDIFPSILSFDRSPLNWKQRELLELGSAVGLVIGVILGGLALRQAIRDRNAAEEKLRRASSAFFDLLNERFAEWNLSPAERDVARLAIKGLSTAEIAALRKTSEGTVKAQTNAIYRKAGVTGRPQLLSLIIDDLMRDDAIDEDRPDRG